MPKIPNQWQVISDGVTKAPEPPKGDKL